MAFFSPEQVTTLSQQTVRVDFLFKMEFVSETIYVYNGDYDLVSGGNTWIPMHGMGKMEGLGQSNGTQSESITLKVVGIPANRPDFLTLALEQTPEANQQFITVFMQLFDSDWQPVGSPVAVWWGFMQPPRVERSPMNDSEGGTQEISITAENAFFNRSRPPFGRYSDRDQQRRSAGDLFFQLVSSLSFKNFTYPDY